jgi:hypothetical protein
MSKPRKQKKSETEQLIVTHIASAQKADGTTHFFWLATDSLEPPPIQLVPPECWNGPYTTEDAASDAALQAVNEFLGPQCTIEDRPGWPEKSHNTIQ